MADRYELLAARIKDVEENQNTPDVPWELLVGILGDIHEVQKDPDQQNCKVADAVFDRIENLYEFQAGAEGFFDRWWKKSDNDEAAIDNTGPAEQ